MLRLTVAWVVVNALLMTPEWLGSAVAGASAGWVALDAALLVGLLASLPRRAWSIALAWAASVAVIVRNSHLMSYRLPQSCD